MPVNKEKARRRNRGLANILIVLLLVCMLGVIIASAINIYQVSKSANSGGDTIETETISNEYDNQ